MRNLKEAFAAIGKAVLKIGVFSILFLALLSLNFVRLFNKVVAPRPQKKEVDKKALDDLWNKAEAQWCGGSCSSCSCSSCH